MFVPRSARRIRFARTLFVLAGLAPCAGLVAWAVHRHSASHREAVRACWEQAVGLPITVAAIEHPLPGVVRGRDCTLAATDGAVVLRAAAVQVETTPAEVRLTIGSLACDPAGAAELARLAAEWLERGARFRRDLVIDVADFAWRVPDSAGGTVRRAVGPLRVECVAEESGRAVRLVRRGADPGGEGNADEVRIVRSIAAGGGGGEGRLDVEAAWADAVPLPILAAVAATGPAAGLSCGPSATVRGRLSATGIAGRWSGTASGSVERVDLAACTAAMPAGAAGLLDLDVRAVEWRAGRLVACEFACSGGAGRVARPLLDSCVAALGCRGGAGYVAAAAEREPAVDAFGCTVRIDGRGVAIEGSPRLGGALAVAGGQPLLDPPAGLVSPARLAWLAAPPGAVYVPATGPGTWLMSVLPPEGGAADRGPGVARGDGRDGF